MRIFGYFSILLPLKINYVAFVFKMVYISYFGSKNNQSQNFMSIISPDILEK
jgi:hypothetical protein